MPVGITEPSISFDTNPASVRSEVASSSTKPDPVKSNSDTRTLWNQDGTAVLLRAQKSNAPPKTHPPEAAQRAHPRPGSMREFSPGIRRSGQASLFIA
jgi:hypothetical protein